MEASSQAPLADPLLDAQMPVSDDRLVTIIRYDATGDAQLAKTQLEDAGIPCMLANTTQSGLAPMFDATEGGVHVKVPADQADAARDVLSLTD